jgi:hypothetical protein
MNLLLPLQLLAPWIGVWLGRVLQEQIDYLKTETFSGRRWGPRESC